MHREEGLDFSQVTTFNLDEYVGLRPKHPQSYHYFMHENFFRHVNIAPGNIYIPSGTTSNYRSFCEWYEQRIEECGGIDVQILGIGSDGHIAFNEPGSSLSSRTRLKTLGEVDDRRQRAVLRSAGGCADLRDHDGRWHDPRSAHACSAGERQEQGGSRRPQWSRGR